MAAAKKAAAEVRVLVPFAYARKTSGEVKQLVKGDLVESDQYDKESLAHLESIGFIGSE